MDIEIGLTDELTNTQYAPLVALSAHYQNKQLLAPLEQVQIGITIRQYTPVCKLKQVLLSILAGCETLTAFNTQLAGEPGLASVWSWKRFADQSTLTRALDALTLMNIEQLRSRCAKIM